MKTKKNLEDFSQTSKTFYESLRAYMKERFKNQMTREEINNCAFDVTNAIFEPMVLALVELTKQGKDISEQL